MSNPHYGAYGGQGPSTRHGHSYASGGHAGGSHTGSSSQFGSGGGGNTAARQPLFGRVHSDRDHQVQINMETGPAFDLDTEIDQLRAGVGRLKEVGNAIHEENKLTRQVMEGLEDAMDKARASLKKTLKRIDRAYRDSKSNHMIYLFFFCIVIFFVVYAWNRVYKLLKWIF